MKAAADELGISEEIVKRELARVLLACGSLADQAVAAAQQPTDTRVELSEEERSAAL